VKAVSGRVQYLILWGALLLAWFVLGFWAGLGLAVTATILLVAVLAPFALIAGHRFVNRWYVVGELAGLVAAVVISALTGFAGAAEIAFAVLIGGDTLICSVLVLMRGRGAFRNVVRNILVILATLGLATGASAVVSAIAPVPSCGAATVGAGGATSQASALAAQCWVTDAETCQPSTLTVHDVTDDEGATHRYRVVANSDSNCHFTDSVTYGPHTDTMENTASYTCPSLTDLVGAPGEQEIKLTQCSSAVEPGVAEPIIPLNAYQPLPSS
jgi:hypothetical protein